MLNAVSKLLLPWEVVGPNLDEERRQLVELFLLSLCTYLYFSATYIIINLGTSSFGQEVDEAANLFAFVYRLY